MSCPDERFYFVALQQIFSERPALLHELLKITGSAKNLFACNRLELRPLFSDAEELWKKFYGFDDWDKIEKFLKRNESLNIHVLEIGNDLYPKLLREIYDPPLVLFVKGRCQNLLNQTSVAVVGSRKAASHNLEIAVDIAEHLSDAGIVVVSGMAYGIDRAAHLGAMRGMTGTIAVLGSGLDIVYPADHAALFSDITETGLAISEFPLGTKAFPGHFPQRNRIISGLCVATVIVEAAEKSGSLITARLALEQGREVMAVPGNAGMFKFRGTNRLIGEGAVLVESGEDVLKLLEKHLPQATFLKKTGHFGFDVDKDSPLLVAIQNLKVASIDELIAATGMSANNVLELLTKFVVAGKIQEMPGRLFSLKGV